MAISDDARARLADEMDDRRVQLGLTWRQVASLGLISYETLRAARKGKGDIASLTRAAIEKGLRWAPGSVSAVLDGGVPTLAVEIPAQAYEAAVAAEQARLVNATMGELLKTRQFILELRGVDDADRFLRDALQLQRDAQERQARGHGEAKSG